MHIEKHAELTSKLMNKLSMQVDKLRIIAHVDLAQIKQSDLDELDIAYKALASHLFDHE